MLDTALEKILKNTFTKHDFYARLGIVKECLEHSLFTTGSDESNRSLLCADFARESGQKEAANYIEEWGGEVMDLFTASNLYEQVENLKEKLESLPVLVLYTPVLLENKEVEEVGRWARGEFDSRVMIELLVDPKALGGCGFVWQGEYHDFSLSYFFEKRQDEISEIIKSYGNK